MPRTFPQVFNASRYWEPSNTPAVENRWILYTNGAVRMSIRYYGKCMNPDCERSLWARQGTFNTTDFMGYNALTILTTEDGVIVRACQTCAGDDYRAARAIDTATAMLADSPDAEVGPWQWPDEGPMPKRLNLFPEPQADPKAKAEPKVKATAKAKTESEPF